MPDYVAVRLIIGLGALYAWCVGLSVAGWMTRIPVATGLLIGAGLFALELEALGAPLRDAFHKVRLWPRSDRILLAGVAGLAGLQIVCGLTPLTFYDLQAYQLYAPLEFIRQGALNHIPWNFLTDTPLALQLTVGTSLSLDSGGTAAKLILAMLGCLAPLAAALLVRDLGPRAALWAAAFVLSYPEFWLQQTLGAVDLAAAGLALLGLSLLRNAFRSGGLGWVVPAGIGLGFAVSSRYQGVLLVTIGSVVLWIEHIRSTPERNRRRAILQLGAAAGISIMMLMPWLARNTVHTGNPVFPFMVHSLGGNDWSVEQADAVRLEGLGPSLASLSPPQKVLAPIGALLIMPGNGLFGIALLVTAVMALGGRRTHSLRAWSVIALIGLFVWGLLRPVPAASLLRYNAVSIVLLLSVAGAVLSVRPLARGGLHAARLLTAGSLLIAFVHVNNIVPVTRILTSAEAHAAYRQSQIPSWQAFEFVNQELDPSEHRILFIGETRAFWSQIPVLAPSSFNSPQLLSVLSPGASAEWLDRLKGLGVTHILVNYPEWQRLNQQAGYLRLPQEETEVLLGWLARLPVIFDDSRGTILFGL